MDEQEKSMVPEENKPPVDPAAENKEELSRREVLRGGSRTVLSGAAAVFLGLGMSNRSTKEAQGWCCCGDCWLNCADCLSGCSGCSVTCGNDCDTGCTDGCTKVCENSCQAACTGGCTYDCTSANID